MSDLHTGRIPAPRRRHAITRRASRGAPAPATARKRGGLTRFLGRHWGGLASALLYFGMFASAFLTDTVESYYGVEALSTIRSNATGADIAPLWVVIAAVALLFMLANGSQWHAAATWDEWTASALSVVKMVPFLIVTFVLGGLQVAVAALGGYALIGGTPETLDAISRPWGALSLAQATFFSIILQFIATRRLVQAARREQ